MYGEVSILVTNEAIVGTLIVGSHGNYIDHKIPLKLIGQHVYAFQSIIFSTAESRYGCHITTGYHCVR